MAEAAARTVAEQLVRVTLASVKDDEAALRADVEQSSAAVAERVARELVEQANVDRGRRARRRPLPRRKTSCRPR